MSHFSPAQFEFMRDLDANNNRDWFKANKKRYEDSVKNPSLGFISDFGPYLHKISTSFSADPKPVGGSLFRIYRDTRFSKDKTPYKTHTGIHFRHVAGKDAHAPGFYLHLDPGESFVAMGLWSPDTANATKIRQAIVDDPKAWTRIMKGKAFSKAFEMGGESLKRPPRGFDKEHPLVEDLKRKSFMASTKLTKKQITSKTFAKDLAKICQTGAPLVRFLCNAVGVEY